MSQGPASGGRLVNLRWDKKSLAEISYFERRALIGREAFSSAC